MPERSGSRLVPKNLPDFQQHFPNDEACIAHLYAKRFQGGFVCRYCKQHEGDAGPPYTFAGRPTVYRCRNCKRDTSLTAGTIMYRSKQPLYTWFWAAFLVTSLTPGMSAVQFKKILGIERYETAFQMLHKLRAAMVRPKRDSIGQKFPGFGRWSHLTACWGGCAHLCGVVQGGAGTSWSVARVTRSAFCCLGREPDRHASFYNNCIMCKGQNECV